MISATLDVGRRQHTSLCFIESEALQGRLVLPGFRKSFDKLDVLEPLNKAVSLITYPSGFLAINPELNGEGVIPVKLEVLVHSQLEDEPLALLYLDVLEP